MNSPTTRSTRNKTTKPTTENQTKYRYECKFCPYKTNHGGTYKRHSQVHNRKAFTCNLCPFETIRFEAFKFHIQIHEKPGTFTCSRCNFQSELLIKLRNHECQRFSCRDCSFKTNSRNVYDDHRLRHSSLEKDFNSLHDSSILICPDCDFQTKMKGSLKLHQLIHRSMQLVCSKCRFTTPFEKLLLLHEKTHTEPADPVHSEAAALSKEDFQQSISDLAQSGIKKDFTCPICGFKSSVASEFKQHLFTHDDKSILTPTPKNKVNKIKCSLCPFSSYSPDLWKKHFSVRHKDKITENPSNIGSTYETKKHQMWSAEEKKEIYWCHVYAKNIIFEWAGLPERRRKIMIKRGIVDRQKIDQTSDAAFQSVVAMIKTNRTKITKKEIEEIEQDVEKYVKTHGPKHS